MKSLLHSVTILSLLVFVCSCKKEPSSIDSDIIVSIYKKENNFILNAKTVVIYGVPQQIDFSKKRVGKHFTIVFKKIIKPGSAFQILSPAKCNVDLGELKLQNYSFTFKLNDEDNKAKLSIINDSLDITFTKSINVSN